MPDMKCQHLNNLSVRTADDCEDDLVGQWVMGAKNIAVVTEESWVRSVAKQLSSSLSSFRDPEAEAFLSMVSV